MKYSVQVLLPFILIFYLSLFNDKFGLAQNTTIPFNVGVVLNFNKLTGRIGLSCISKALSDFYATHSSYKTRLVVHTRDSQNNVVKAIASIVKAFRWKEAVLIYENTDYGSGIVPYLVDAFSEIETSVPYRSVLPLLATDDQILLELYKLMTMQTRVFVVHMSYSLAARLFLKAKDVGMMNEGYAWIIANGLSNQLNSMDISVLHSMQGVISIESYVPISDELTNFKIRWTQKFHKENPDMNRASLNIFGLRAYGTVWALALAAEKVGAGNIQYQHRQIVDAPTDISTLGISTVGPKLLQAILETKFTGLSGEFSLVDGQLQSSVFRLKIGVPVKNHGLANKFVKVAKDPVTNATIVTGYCIDVFNAVIKELPYALPYEFIPFMKSDGTSAGTCNDLVYQVYLRKYDAVVGDTTIRANRSLYVDFTMPYTESGVTMIVPIQQELRKNMWVFLKPLNRDLWFTILSFFIFTGFVIWVLEHRVNKDFRGSPINQLGMTFCYTASLLTSMLTVQQLQPKVTDVKELIRNGEYVEYTHGSFVFEVLQQMGFNESKIITIRDEELDESLSKGSGNGGIAAAFDEIPYVKLFLSKYCNKYTMAGPTYKTDGFAFVFPRGSPLVADVSRAVLYVTEGDKMTRIEQAWFGQDNCPGTTDQVSSYSLTLDSFGGLFIITGTASLLALVIFLLCFCHQNDDKQNIAIASTIEASPISIVPSSPPSSSVIDQCCSPSGEDQGRATTSPGGAHENVSPLEGQGSPFTTRSNVNMRHGEELISADSIGPDAERPSVLLINS
ncbi:hypothetical protein NE237_024895 [Protea cynaroides]|uniref:Glutamate receptor n=1 Tax=Protea cynaroides TaxID=273540 RepID=A0A9Q0JYZ5_9MAGN|nr:hypothetical protein NE237_024895 [Protea cynaroides]